MTQEASIRKWGQGGLGILCWHSHLKLNALQQRWITRYLDASRSQYKHLLDIYLADSFPEGRGVLLTSTPLKDITDTLPKEGAYGYWRGAISAFRAMGVVPRPINDDDTLCGVTMGAEPTFTNLRMDITALHHTFHPSLWESRDVPESIDDLIDEGF